MRHVLVTGGAGFIGSHLIDALLSEGCDVTAVDNFDPFYARTAKEANIKTHRGHPRWRLVEVDLRDVSALHDGLPEPYDTIVHLAAKAGVRPSMDDLPGYLDVNVRGTQNLLELARARHIPQFIFASSSSVYGVNPRVPWREDDAVLKPISPYASTKVSGELLGHVYSYLYGIRFLALRFFTVYGPRQRPDLAIHKFTRLIESGEPVPVYGDGSTRRDYTYIDDIITGVRAAIEYTASPYEVINLGNNQTVTLSEMIAVLEDALGIKAKIQRLPERPGDVSQTWSSIDKARALLGYDPLTTFPDGVRKFAEWLHAGSKSRV